MQPKLIRNPATIRRFPVTLTLFHMSLAAICTRVLNRSTKLDALTYKQWCGVAFLALAFAAGIVLGNVALVFIPISLDQAIGSTTPACVAIINMVILRKKEALAVYATLVPIIGELALGICSSIAVPYA